MKKQLIGVAAAALALALSACGGGTAPPAGSPGAETTPATPVKIGVSFDTLNEIRSAELAAIESAAEKHGYAVEFVSADSDAQKQATQIQDLVQAQNVDALIVIAWNKDQINSSIALAKSQGVPFVAMDRAPADQENITYQITGAPVVDGELAAKQMIETGSQLKVLHLLGALTDQNAIGRRDGFKAALEGQSAIEIVAEVPTEWDPGTALDATSNALQKDPDINAIFVPSDYLLSAVQSALEGANRVAKVGEDGHIFIVTIDGDPVGCQALRDGLIDANIATDVNTFGERAVDAVRAALAGESIDPKIEELEGVPLTQANYAEVSPSVWGCQ